MANGAVVTTIGKKAIAAIMNSANLVTHAAFGTGTTTPAVTDTALVTAVDLDTAAAWAIGSDSTTNAIYTVVTSALSAVGAGRSITEVGLFDAAAFGSTHLIYREVHTAVVLSQLDTITYSIAITVG